MQKIRNSPGRGPPGQNCGGRDAPHNTCHCEEAGGRRGNLLQFREKPHLFATKCLKIQGGIATPVCGLVRNDSVFGLFRQPKLRGEGNPPPPQWERRTLSSGTYLLPWACVLPPWPLSWRPSGRRWRQPPPRCPWRGDSGRFSGPAPSALCGCGSCIPCRP